MAISKIKPRHASEGRSIAAVLKDRIDYDKNPDIPSCWKSCRTFRFNLPSIWGAGLVKC